MGVLASEALLPMQRCSNILTHTCISSDGQSGSGMWDTDYSIRAVLTGRVSSLQFFGKCTAWSLTLCNQSKPVLMLPLSAQTLHLPMLIGPYMSCRLSLCSVVSYSYCCFPQYRRSGSLAEACSNSPAFWKSLCIQSLL